MAGEIVRSVLRHVLRALEPLDRPSALIGGMALASWGYPRATRDVDLLIGAEAENIDEIVEALQSCGCVPKHSPPLIAVGDHHFAQFLYTPPDAFYDIQLDLLLAESELQKAALSRAVEQTIPGLDDPVSVLSCGDLILFKLISGRMIDRADAAMLLRENRDDLELDSISDWITRLELNAEFAEIWREAFPGEEGPF